MKKTVIIVIILAVLATAGWHALKKFRAEQEALKTPAVETDTAAVRTIIEKVKITGQVSPLLSSEIKSEISGRIKSIGVKNGERVVKGQLLLELDVSELESEAEAGERAVESARLRTARSERDFDRNRELFEQNFITAKAFEDYKTDLALSRNEFEIQEARHRTIQEKISKTAILAPHHGIVINLSVTEGGVISGATSFSQGTILMEVADLGTLLVESNINEIDVARIYPGIKAEVRFDPIPDFTVEAVVAEISPSARLQEKVRVFPVRIVFTSDDSHIKPGMSTNVSISVSQADDVVSVVVSALFSDDDEKFVFLSKGDEWTRQPVEVGINDAEFVEVKSGLASGEVVALTRPPEFADQRRDDIKKKKMK
jgi:HlyD family secretion protein